MKMYSAAIFIFFTIGNKMSDMQNIEMGKYCKISQCRPIVCGEPTILGKLKKLPLLEKVHTDCPYPTSGDTPHSTMSVLTKQ